MRKRLFIFVLIFVLIATIFVSCAQKEQTVFQLLNININKIDKIELVGGIPYKKIDITEQTNVDKIIAMCNTVKLKFSQKGCPSGDFVGVNFYHGEQLLNGFVPNLQVAYMKGDTYTITSGSYDLDALEAMMGVS